MSILFDLLKKLSKKRYIRTYLTNTIALKDSICLLLKASKKT